MNKPKSISNLPAQNDESGKNWSTDPLLLLVVLFWGINIPIMKFALERIDRYAFNFVRLSLSTFVLGLIVFWCKAPLIDRSEGAPPIKRQATLILLFALFTAFIYQVVFLMGIDLTSAGNTALIMAAVPMWIAILSLLFLRERLSFTAWTGLFVALAGVLVVTLNGAQVGKTDGSVLGNLLISTAALAWAAGSVMSKPLMRNISPVALTFYAFLITLPLHFLLMIGKFDELNKLATDWKLLAALCYSGIFSTGLANAMWNVGIKRVRPSRAAGFQNLVPLVALGASWLLIGEVPFFIQICGGALIIVGLIVMLRKKNKQ